MEKDQSGDRKGKVWVAIISATIPALAAIAVALITTSNNNSDLKNEAISINIHNDNSDNSKFDEGNSKTNKFYLIKKKAEKYVLLLKAEKNNTSDARKSINLQYWIEYFEKIEKYNNSSIGFEEIEIENSFKEASKLFENE